MSLQAKDFGIEIYQTFQLPPPNTIQGITLSFLESQWKNTSNNATITRQELLQVFYVFI